MSASKVSACRKRMCDRLLGISYWACVDEAQTLPATATAARMRSSVHGGRGVGFFHGARGLQLCHLSSPNGGILGAVLVTLDHQTREPPAQTGGGRTRSWGASDEPFEEVVMNLTE